MCITAKNHRARRLSFRPSTIKSRASFDINSCRLDSLQSLNLESLLDQNASSCYYGIQKNEEFDLADLVSSSPEVPVTCSSDVMAVPELSESSSSSSVNSTLSQNKSPPYYACASSPRLLGLTAKNQIRHFVHHDYHDHAYDLPSQPVVVSSEETSSNDNKPKNKKPRRTQRSTSAPQETFPMKLHRMLLAVEESGEEDIISWQPHGRSFVIHKPRAFVDQVMPKFFNQSKLTSFQRQLNLYGFERLTRGRDAGGYYNELFLRGREFLISRMSRTKIKGTGYKAAGSPETEPNFYEMPYVVTLGDGITSPQVITSNKHQKELDAPSMQQHSSSSSADYFDMFAGITSADWDYMTALVSDDSSIDSGSSTRSRRSSEAIGEYQIPDDELALITADNSNDDVMQSAMMSLIE